ncbi:hypothetical protein [Sphingopyxis terrae]|uniref:hypothetical protein n=1 Tax=Sphingopyxis terrae TaxID=33052 RepID=UPI000AEDDC40|nr:hypothetical protein [Sphingopyxis terrae]
MNELLSKISSYNIFNYLFPGAVFSIVADHLNIVAYPSDVIDKLLWFYFIGMAISRIGSVVVEPLLRCWSFVTYSDYPRFLRACASDAKLELMVEVSNTYRTLATAFALLPLGLLAGWIAGGIGFPAPWRERLILLPLLVLFLFSFRKQVGYIQRRVNHHGGE